VPASARSFQVTNQYRRRIVAIRERVVGYAAREWPTIDEFDRTRWPERVSLVVASAQTEAVRAAAGYLTAYLSTETGRKQRAVGIDSRRYSGLSRDGRPLAEALQSPLIGVRAALKEGKPAPEALAYGLNRARRMVSVDFDHAHQSALTDTIAADERFTGWERATAGTCGACMALSGTSGPHFEVHPNCECVAAPVVSGVTAVVAIATGAQLFQRLSRDEQDARFGEDKAEALRTGSLDFEDLVQKSKLKTDQPNFITEAPLDAAGN
jgi:hypothetical protein